MNRTQALVTPAEWMTLAIPSIPAEAGIQGYSHPRSPRGRPFLGREGAGG